MIDTEEFLNCLLKNKIKTFYGVPDSLLKPLCGRLLDLPYDLHQITTHESTSIAAALGHHLATGEIGCVYLQNSGLGNTVNPLISLASKDVYSIPLLLIVGWRGEVNQKGEQLKDEPQHVHQGKITLEQLKVLDIPYKIIGSDDTDWELKVDEIIKKSVNENRVTAIVFRKNTFESYTSSRSNKNFNNEFSKYNLSITREEAIKEIAKFLPKNIPIFSTTGMASRELYEFRKNNDQKPIDFYTVGGMGCASSIALGFLRGSKKIKQVCCLDGDGSVLMHLGSLFKVSKEKGFIHIIINNNAHDSVGGQPTEAFNIDFKGLGNALGYGKCFSISSKKEIEGILKNFIPENESSVLIEIKVLKGNRGDLGRPKEKPNQNKKIFMEKWADL